MEAQTFISVQIKGENALKRVKDFKILSSTCPNRTNKKILDDTYHSMCIVQLATSTHQVPFVSHMQMKCVNV